MPLEELGARKRMVGAPSTVQQREPWCPPAEVGCTTAISLPEHPVAVAYVNQLDNFPSVGTVSVILHNFDSFLATHGLTATDGTLQHIIDQGFPDMIIERSAWVEAEQPNPRYPPLRQ